METMPVGEAQIANITATLLGTVENAFGASVTDIAKMLRVSRPMVYHYRQGMEPSAENKTRLQTLALLANDWSALTDQPLKIALKAKQPEGGTLLDFLSGEKLDIATLRPIVQRTAITADHATRRKLADALATPESTEARADIARERHAEWKPVYVGDPETPGKLIQLLPDGTRVRGRIINRQFVADDE